LAETYSLADKSDATAKGIAKAIDSKTNQQYKCCVDINSKDAESANARHQAKAWEKKAIELEAKVDPKKASKADKASLAKKVASDIKAQGQAKKTDAKEKADDKKAKEKAKAQEKKVE